ncbi:MAG: NYN domain-containing protein [Candidatus Vogelbacteria bacterium]|nr:NYN domain-containing protein [Candidatus Vogelbacteria bacterium]
MKNFAFIDAHNVHLGIKSLGWKLDWKKFRVYLKEKYSVTTVYLFIGFIQSNQDLYSELQKAGFVCIFKPIIFDGEGKAKGNCDADLVLRIMIELPNFDKAVIVTSDGDFYSLVRYLRDNNKLLMVLSPYVKTCSKLLKQEARPRINYLNDLPHKMAGNENAPHKDETL